VARGGGAWGNCGEDEQQGYDGGGHLGRVGCSGWVDSIGGGRFAPAFD
jgi:hypothetical protein